LEDSSLLGEDAEDAEDAEDSFQSRLKNVKEKIVCDGLTKNRELSKLSSASSASSYI